MTKVLTKTKIRTRRRNGTRWSVQLEFKLSDFWIGGFWNATKGPDHRWAVLDVWVCLVPCVPIHFFFNRRPKEIPFGIMDIRIVSLNEDATQ